MALECSINEVHLDTIDDPESEVLYTQLLHKLHHKRIYGRSTVFENFTAKHIRIILLLELELARKIRLENMMKIEGIFS